MNLWFSGKPIFSYVIFIVSQWLAMIIESSFAVYKNPFSIYAIRRSFRPLNGIQEKFKHIPLPGFASQRCFSNPQNAAKN